MFRAFVGFSEPGLVYVRLFSSSRGVPAQRLWNRQRHLGRGLFSPFGGFRARLSRSEHLAGKRFPSNWTRTVRDVGEDVFIPPSLCSLVSRCVCPVVGLTGVVPLCGGAAHAWSFFAV